MAIDAAALAEIGRLYREGVLTVAEIGRRHNRSPTSISRLARAHGWPMRWDVMGYAPRARRLSTPKARALLVHKLCDAIATKLEQMEKGMRSGELGSADFERDAKSVASMIGAMDKVAATVADADKERQPKSASTGAGEAPASSEAERLHREIIERFERIQRRREAQGGLK